MIYVGIDVAKNKHDCCILSENGQKVLESFTIKNNYEGYNKLYNSILKNSQGEISAKVGLENTGHYSLNIERWLKDKGLDVVAFNPIQTTTFRKSQTLRKTKTDKADAKSIAMVLYLDHNTHYDRTNDVLSDLKFLTRHRHRLLHTKGQYCTSITRLLDIIFPELATYVWSVHANAVYEMLLAYPTTKDILEADLDGLTTVLNKGSRGQFTTDDAIAIQKLASESIGYANQALAFELVQTIHIVRNLSEEIKIADKRIKEIVDSLNTPILTIPGISYTLAAIILAEIGNIENFSSPAKLQAFAGLDPSIHESGTYKASQSHMVKRGSGYLRYAIVYAARHIVLRDEKFALYLQKKRDEGKPYNVAIGHVSKKLIRVIFYMLKNNEPYDPNKNTTQTA